jgi:hypothetical protein
VGVTLQLQTLVNDRLLIPRCKVVGLRFFRATLQNHESTDLTYYSMPDPEVLSYLSFATGITMSCVEKISFETAKYTDLSSVKQAFDYEYTYDVIPAMYGTVATARSKVLVAIRPVDRTLSGVNVLLQEDMCTNNDTAHDPEIVSVMSVGVQVGVKSCLICKALFTPVTGEPSSSPTNNPSGVPTVLPSVDSAAPTVEFSTSPTGHPTSSIPTGSPSSLPTDMPRSSLPTHFPTLSPTTNACPETTNTSTDVTDLVTGEPVTSVWLEGGFTSVVTRSGCQCPGLRRPSWRRVCL